MSSNYNGQFLTVEGIDGSGKTTVVRKLSENLLLRRTREPTNSPIGQLAGEFSNENCPKYLDLFLFLADRINHIEEYIIPALEQGDKIICDRFSDSTIAYQTVGKSTEEAEFIRRAARMSDITPDLTILLDIPVDVALERCSGDSYENKEFLEEVRVEYLHLARNNNRIKRVDATQEAGEVLKECAALVEESNGSL